MLAVALSTLLIKVWDNLYFQSALNCGVRQSNINKLMSNKLLWVGHKWLTYDTRIRLNLSITVSIVWLNCCYTFQMKQFLCVSLFISHVAFVTTFMLFCQIFDKLFWQVFRSSNRLLGSLLGIGNIVGKLFFGKHLKSITIESCRFEW